MWLFLCCCEENVDESFLFVLHLREALSDGFISSLKGRKRSAYSHKEEVVCAALDTNIRNARNSLRRFGQQIGATASTAWPVVVSVQYAAESIIA